MEGKVSVNPKHEYRNPPQDTLRWKQIPIYECSKLKKIVEKAATLRIVSRLGSRCPLSGEWQRE